MWNDMKWNLQKYIFLSKKCSGTSNLNFTFSLSSAISVKDEVMQVGVIAAPKNWEGNINLSVLKCICHVNFYPVTYVTVKCINYQPLLVKNDIELTKNRKQKGRVGDSDTKEKQKTERDLLNDKSWTVFDKQKSL